jgi:hypothetical protein
MNIKEQIKSYKIAEEISYYLTEKIDVTDNEKSIFNSNVEQWIKELEPFDYVTMCCSPNGFDKQMAALSYIMIKSSTDPIVQKVWKLIQIRIRKNNIDKDFEV